ncbi:Aldose reductase B [Diplonema papillatum]|nr:Aldose reductase B [Diplonema papillatum]
MAFTGKTVKLSTGYEMPIVGLGTWQSGKDGEVQKAVVTALEKGYRHIDCAAVYGNEKEVGEGLAEAFSKGVCKREDVFVVSKIWNTFHEPEDVLPQLKKSLKDLQLEYLDLYLVHWPIAFQKDKENPTNMFPKAPSGLPVYADISPSVTFKAMTELPKDLVRSVGVSNYNKRQIEEATAAAGVAPAVIQIESHPYFLNDKLITFALSKGIQVTAYSPLGAPARPWVKADDPVVLKDPVVLAIADKHKVSAGQVLIRFQLERGVTCIPKSGNPDRIAQNFDVMNLKLSDDEVKQLKALNKDYRACVPSITNNEGKTVPRDASHPHFPWNEEY